MNHQNNFIGAQMDSPAKKIACSSTIDEIIEVFRFTINIKMYKNHRDYRFTMFTCSMAIHLIKESGEVFRFTINIKMYKNRRHG
jgi:hypothetical protein